MPMIPSSFFGPKNQLEMGQIGAQIWLFYYRNDPFKIWLGKIRQKWRWSNPDKMDIFVVLLRRCVELAYFRDLNPTGTQKGRVSCNWNRGILNWKISRFGDEVIEILTICMATLEGKPFISKRGLKVRWGASLKFLTFEFLIEISREGRRPC